MSVSQKSSPGAPGTSLAELESPEAIAVVDDILAGVGLSHGKRSTRSNTWSDGERRPVGKKQQAAVKAARKPSSRPEPLYAENLQRLPGVQHGFSTRAGGTSHVYRPSLPQDAGDLNLGFTSHDDPENVRANRRIWLEALDADKAFSRFALLRQKHSPVIRVVHSPEEASNDFLLPGSMQGDGVLTDVPGVLLTIQTADCIPVLLCDPVRRAVGAFHAGWRGTLARIVERGIGSMRLLYGSDPKDIVAAVGPGIGPASYAVGEEIRYEFESQFDYAPALFSDVYESEPIREKYPLLFLTARAPGHSPIGPQLHLDLWEANRRQLLEAGIPETNICVLGQDTAADTGRFFSYRAEEGFTGRMMSAIGLQP